MNDRGRFSRRSVCLFHLDTISLSPPASRRDRNARRDRQRDSCPWTSSLERDIAVRVRKTSNHVAPPPAFLLKHHFRFGICLVSDFVPRHSFTFLQILDLLTIVPSSHSPGPGPPAAA